MRVSANISSGSGWSAAPRFMARSIVVAKKSRVGKRRPQRLGKVLQFYRGHGPFSSWPPLNYGKVASSTPPLGKGGPGGVNRHRTTPPTPPLPRGGVLLQRANNQFIQALCERQRVLDLGSLGDERLIVKQPRHL